MEGTMAGTFESAANNDSTLNNGRYKDNRKYRVDIDALIDFIFPKNLQHPLASGRLYAFGLEALCK
jgi:hypothetical protein